MHESHRINGSRTQRRLATRSGQPPASTPSSPDWHDGSTGTSTTAGPARLAEVVPSKSHLTWRNALTAVTMASGLIGSLGGAWFHAAPPAPPDSQPVTHTRQGLDSVSLGRALQGQPDTGRALQGPVLVVDIASLRDGADPAVLRGVPGGPVSGARDMLQSVDALGVPIIYLDETQNKTAAQQTADTRFLQQFPAGVVLQPHSLGLAPRAALLALQQAYPQARLFEVGHDAGANAADFDGIGVMRYLLNDDATQKQVPTRYNGSLTDNFTPEFRARLLSDISSGKPLLPVNTIPANHGKSGTGATLESYGHLAQLFGGVPLHLVSATLPHPGALQQAQSSSDAQLQALSAQSLAELGDGILDNLPSPSQGAAFMRVLTAHGQDAGHVDAIRIMMHKDPATELGGPARAVFNTLSQSQRAVRGDWAAYQPYLDAATGTQARLGSLVEPLINGSQGFPAMLNAIDNAHESVNMSVFSFQSDETGWEFAHHLAAKAQSGVPVRLMYDPIGSENSNGSPTDPAIFAMMRQAGVQIIPQPIRTQHVTHRKILVVDSHIGFDGGMNIGNEYRDSWHDVHARITGPAVVDLFDLFHTQWLSNGGSPLPEAMRHVPAPVNDTSLTRVVGHIGQHDQNMKLAYLRAIDTAKDTINIADPYFTDADVAEHLAQAARDGVTVNLVLPAVNDTPHTQMIERSMYNKLIAAGVNIYEYSGRPMAHGKVATFDGQMATIGSSNLDIRSLLWNDEANVWTLDPSVVKHLDQQFFALDLLQSRHVSFTPMTWMSRLQQLEAGVLRPLQ